MRNLLSGMLILVLAGCHAKDKIVEQQQQNIILEAMVNGQWVVTNYTRNGTDVTSDYSGYRFQFQRNFTVEAIFGGRIQNTGIWSATGDIQAQFITAAFNNAPAPLPGLNGTWQISNTTWTTVDATQTVGTETRLLSLQKQ